MKEKIQSSFPANCRKTINPFNISPFLTIQNIGPKTHQITMHTQCHDDLHLNCRRTHIVRGNQTLFSHDHSPSAHLQHKARLIALNPFQKLLRTITRNDFLSRRATRAGWDTSNAQRVPVRCEDTCYSKSPHMEEACKSRVHIVRVKWVIAESCWHAVGLIVSIMLWGIEDRSWLWDPGQACK